jgi:hypothetical protein
MCAPRPPALHQTPTASPISFIVTTRLQRLSFCRPYCGSFNPPQQSKVETREGEPSEHTMRGSKALLFATAATQLALMPAGQTIPKTPNEVAEPGGRTRQSRTRVGEGGRWFNAATFERVADDYVQGSA